MTFSLLCFLDQLTPIISIVAILYLARKVHQMSQASDRVAASAAALSASVDNAVAKLASQPADDSAQLNAVADVLDAAKSKLDGAASPPPASTGSAPAPSNPTSSTPVS